jgi:tetratricopeptide (TPR) repeat protein
MVRTDAGLVDIAREFLLAHRELRRLFEHHRHGALRWEEVRQLVGGDESSVLFRLKERSHALFRAGVDEAELPRVALFDLAVGSLFHEAMKLRENFYQLEVYAPKVEAARIDADPGSEPLFDEFTRILRASRVRLEEALGESESLLEQTRRQFRVLLATHRENGFVTRYLIENAALAQEVLGESLDALLASIHGEAVAGYALAARSYLESGYFDEARHALAEAAARDPGRSDLRTDAAYAEGMSAWLRGSYEEALEHLERWAAMPPAPADAGFRALALAAVSRLGQLVEGERAAALSARARALGAALASAATAPA